ncbi:hypothetical protein [Burkholderia sp. 8Y]|uniref:hypothetical protein n=1 Tax=Burkholderia sp. 8Y TaxID=2653133 RepID=UPI001F2AF8C2|nr:hypothetical protein [Burkholderia sp. 8Y]
MDGPLTICSKPHAANIAGTTASFESGAVPPFIALIPRDTSTANNTQTHTGVPAKIACKDMIVLR